jgi:2'-5' RNA ligase
MMRCFIAVEFRDDFFKDIQGKIDASMAKMKLTSSYHLTLKFLGEVEDDKIEEIKQRLMGVEFSTFELVADKIGFFPGGSKIRVIWAGFEDNKEIMMLQEQVDGVLEGMFEPDKRFHPHVTLARVKNVKDKEGFKQNIASIEVEKKFKVDGFKLIKSTLTPEGPVYEELAVFKA